PGCIRPESPDAEYEKQKQKIDRDSIHNIGRLPYIRRYIIRVPTISQPLLETVDGDVRIEHENFQKGRQQPHRISDPAVEKHCQPLSYELPDIGKQIAHPIV